MNSIGLYNRKMNVVWLSSAINPPIKFAFDFKKFELKMEFEINYILE